jgi:hypothetical protein
VSASFSGERVRVRIDDGTEQGFDHVILATGYHVDVSKYGFLAPELLSSLRITNGFPVLHEGLETSIPGLHMLGAPASWSFGPLLMFVAGTGYATRALERRVTTASEPR